MDRRHRLLRRLPLVAGATVALAALVGLVLFVWRYVSQQDEGPKREVQVVQIVRPPPPPPDQPPPPPPPEEKIEDPLPQDEPEPTPSEEPAPSEQLGLDAEGSAGGDAFGLAARKGGRDITGSGSAIFGWYTTLVKDQVSDCLASDQRVNREKFAVVLRVWVNADGTLRDARVASSSGDPSLDDAIESALRCGARVRERPPLEMPQPISLRVVSRS